MSGWLSTSHPLPAGAPAPASSRSTGLAGWVPIADHGLIGNARTAALVSREGSVDWLCLPRFDGASVFARVLDPDGGHFSIRPSALRSVERRYLPGTNVLETTFTTSSGRAVLRDLMPVEEHAASPQPEHELLREVVGLEGQVELELDYAPRPDYARRRPRIQDRGALGIRSSVAGGLLTLRTDVPCTVEDGHARARFRVRAGERRYASLTFDRDAPAVLVELGEAARRRVVDTTAWWRRWTERCTYDGPYRDAVMRSVLVLKLLTYAPSGAIIAAPTTSLPETVGGARNWDYRYCWLRDASFTLRALLGLGYTEEGEAFLGWLLHATRLTHPELQVVYDVFGGTHLAERELTHLSGYAGSRPVRIGNGAADQLQLDVYGEVMDAAVRFASSGGRLDADQRELLLGIGELVCERWREPDDGIWEPRSGRRQHTHSKVLAWVALDGLLQLDRAGHLRAPRARLRREAEAIRRTIESRAWDERANSYVGTLDDPHASVDASLLTLPLYGYRGASEARMRGTIRRIEAELGSGPLLYRYRPGLGDDGLEGTEGAFGIASFWLVEALALAGEVDRASRLFEDMLAYQSDLGLMAEEIEPSTGAALGNFPQALTHIGLVNAALTLEAASHGRSARTT